ncbi:MAG: acetyl-CoA C-acetyltransferase [Verrucomicrobiae bacterium]|nr:acetyl-CoA C-acetyltransferase [Verrucomicrobiae bacterium]
MKNTVVITSAVRTPIGSFGGTLKDIPASALGAIVLKEALVRSQLQGGDVSQVVMGQIYTAGAGANPARQAAMAAGVPKEIPATTVNMVCGSGLRAVEVGTWAILGGQADVVLAGGMESMSSAPYLLPHLRWGKRMGHDKAVDSLIHDALWDCFNDYHMGVTAENLAKEYAVTREDQDRFALQSHQRADAAHKAGRFTKEIVPIEVTGKKGAMTVFGSDEHPRPDTSLEKLATLKPSFDKSGTVTAGNSSGINDGAAAVVVMSGEAAQARGIIPLARIVATKSVGVEPSRMGIGPAMAIRAMLAEQGLTISDIDLMEVNEAFAAQTLAVGRELGWDEARVNVNGGAIALGHPVGASGCRVLVTLLHEMQKRQSRRGIAALCIGGGMGIAMLVEKV